jgi:hypothetical protein
MALLTPKARDNLCKLASHLQSLPPDYSHFDMSTWFHGLRESKYKQGESQVWDCGTSACLAGHGPAAGIKFEGVNDWNLYAYQILDSSPWDAIKKMEKVYNFLFMSHFDSDHYDAAARIRAVLDNDGVPKNGGWAKYRNDKQVPKEVEPA